jgi:hypothetical protein
MAQAGGGLADFEILCGRPGTQSKPIEKRNQVCRGDCRLPHFGEPEDSGA